MRKVVQHAHGAVQREGKTGEFFLIKRRRTVWTQALPDILKVYQEKVLKVVAAEPIVQLCK